jgi:hypothetical protein
MQLRFAHGAFQAQKKTVVEVSRIADTVFIENECVGQRCELKQAMPICIVPREPGHFQSEYDSGVADSNLRHQFLETIALLRAGSWQTKVTVNDMNALDRPAQRDSTVAQRVLALGAFGVLEYLSQRRLPHV